MRKKIGHRDCSPWRCDMAFIEPMHRNKPNITYLLAHRELTWPKWSQPAMTEPWPGPWLSCDLALTEPWWYWRCCDWAVTSPWLSCDLAVTELWPRRDWAVTSPSHDWAVIIGPGAVTTVSSPWQFFSLGCDWLAKWIIMLRFMDLRWPRVFRRSNVGLVFISCRHNVNYCLLYYQEVMYQISCVKYRQI